jgi:hypothetical protein
VSAKLCTEAVAEPPGKSSDERPTGTTVNPIETEWHVLTIRRSIPSKRRSPTFNPLARRAKNSSPFDSTSFCRLIRPHREFEPESR